MMYFCSLNHLTLKHFYSYIIIIVALFSCQEGKKIQYSALPQLPAVQTDKPAERERWEIDRVKDPITGEIPKQNLVDVFVENGEEKQRGAAVTNMNWYERGPNNIGGRTRAILFDKKDTSYKTVWAASVGGGLFKCNDITALTPTWNKFNDFFSNLAVSCMAQHPTNPDTMYFGTGEGFFNADAIFGLGIWRSTDNGNNWTQLPSVMGASVPSAINRLAISTEGVVYASTSNGLYRSTNGGNTWTAVLTSSTVPATSSNTGRDVKIKPNGDIIYTCRTQVWKFTKFSNTWTNVTPAGGFDRIEVAVSPTDTNFAYLLCQSNASSAVTGFFSSRDGGNTWTSRAVPLVYDQAATATTELSRGQAWYDLSLTVDPLIPTTIYAGGIEYIKSNDTGATYKQITAWSLFAIPGASNLTGNQSMHSDHHILTFRPGSNSFALFGNDGGIYRSQDMHLVWPALPRYGAINTNYNVTQFYSCAIGNTVNSNIMLAGAQDNGSLKFNAPGINSVTAASGGDGCYTFIDQTNQLNQISSYVYNTYYVSTNGTTFSTLTGSNTTSGSFVNPSELDDVNDILYTNGGANTISRWKNVFGAASKLNITATVTGTISQIKVSPNNPKTIYLGTTSGKVYRINNADTISFPMVPTSLNATAFGGRISCIEVRKSALGTDDTILVTQSNYNLSNSVLITTNGTSVTPTWTDIDDNLTLPNIPINWCLFAPKSKAQEVVLATEMGIYTCDDIFAATPIWGQSITGFANVRVDMIKMRSADSMIIAGTHGRGVFTTDKYVSPKADFAANKLVTYIASPVQFTDGSVKATSWQWDFDNNGSIDDTTKNPIWAYGTAGYKNVRLIINNGFTSKVRNLYILVLPNRGIPYTLAQGGNFDTFPNDFGAITTAGTPWERGNSTIAGKNGTVSGNFAWVTGLTAATYANLGYTYLYTPNFNLSKTAIDTIKFFIKNSIETTFDGTRVEYSLDRGATWLPLGTTVEPNWYDYSNTSTGRPFPTNQAFISSNYATFTLKKHTLSSLVGNQEVAFRFVFGTDNSTVSSGVAIDNFEITSSQTTPVYTPVETALASKKENIGPNDTVHFYSPNGKIMASIVNLSSHNYGLTKVEIDHAGTTPFNFSTNTSNASKIAGKTISITPANNNPTGAYRASLYYTNAEISGWSAVTGLNYAQARLFKCPIKIDSGTRLNSVYGVAPFLTTYSYNDSSITANFSTGFSGFGIGGIQTLLPVELLNFDVLKLSDRIQLNWSTASEKNNRIFEIERSVNGRDFIKIGEVKGAGNSREVLHYEFFDADYSLANVKILYYRLKQIDFDGLYEYSKIKSVIIDDKIFNVEIFPNPASEFIDIMTNWKSGFSYVIYNTQGSQMMSGESITGNTHIDTKALPSGNYMIELKSNGETKKLRLVVE